MTAQIGKEVFSISIDATTCNSVDDNYNFIKYFAARSSIRFCFSLLLFLSSCFLSSSFPFFFSFVTCFTRDVEDEINVLQRKGENFSKLQEKAIQLSTEYDLLLFFFSTSSLLFSSPLLLNFYIGIICCAGTRHSSSSTRTSR